jgi:hypothetical protein
LQDSVGARGSRGCVPVVSDEQYLQCSSCASKY